MAVFPTRPSPYNLVQGVARQYPLQEATVDGTLSAVDSVVVLGGTGARALWMPAPTRANDTGFIRIVATTAEAHVITSAVGWNANDSTATMTFGGAIGDVALVTLYNGELYVDDTTAITIS